MNIDLEKMVQWLNALYGMPKIGVVFIFCLAFGMVVKKLSFIHNSAIPLLVPMAGTIALPLLSDWPDSAAKTVMHFIFLNMVIGFIVGVSATLFHRYALKPLLTKIGGGKSDDDSNPELFKKDPPASEPMSRAPNPPPVSPE